MRAPGVHRCSPWRVWFCSWLYAFRSFRFPSPPCFLRMSRANPPSMVYPIHPPCEATRALTTPATVRTAMGSLPSIRRSVRPCSRRCSRSPRPPPPAARSICQGPNPSRTRPAPSKSFASKPPRPLGTCRPASRAARLGVRLRFTDLRLFIGPLDRSGCLNSRGPLNRQGAKVAKEVHLAPLARLARGAGPPIEKPWRPWRLPAGRQVLAV